MPTDPAQEPVFDEHDERSDGARRRRDGSWLLSGLLRPDEASAITGVRIPEKGSYGTLGGLIQASLGRIPRVSDTVSVVGAQLRVQRMDVRRVDRLVLTPDPPADSGVAGSADGRPR